MRANPGRDSADTFRRRLVAGQHVIGTFLKTPTPHAAEILGDLGFDFVVIDEEHAPFDRQAIDIALLAARAAGTAGLVRVADAGAPGLLSALDSGAAGVLVPHVASAARAREVVSHCRYRGGRRGFSNSPRAGRYGGVSMWQHVDAQDAAIAVIAMIEDAEALDEIDAIVQVEGLDAFFVGRGDLTVALGAPSMDAPAVRSAVERIVSSARAAAKAVCAMAGDTADAKWLKEMGVTAFIVSSDQGFMRKAAAQALRDFSALSLQDAVSRGEGRSLS